MGFVIAVAVIWGLIVIGPLGWAVLAVVLIGMMIK